MMFKKSDRKPNEAEINKPAGAESGSGSEKSASFKAEDNRPAESESTQSSADRPSSQMVNQRKTVAEPESTQPSVDQRSLRAADHSGTAAESASSEKKAVDNPENNEPEKELFNPFYNYHKRKFPIWQRLVALISLSALAMVVGAMVGYGLLGHSNPFAVFNWHTWQHIIDFVKKD